MRRCDICGKGMVIGMNVSHAHNRNKTRVYPNLQKIRVYINGARKKLKVCTRCLRSGKVQKWA